MGCKALVVFALLLVSTAFAGDLTKDAITADLVYPKLISFDQDLTKATLTYEYCNPFPASFKLPNNLLSTEYKNEEGKTSTDYKHTFQINKTITELVPIYKTTEKTINYTYYDNKTSENKTGTRKINYTEIDHYVANSYEGWAGLSEVTVSAYSCIKIKHTVTGAPRYGTQPIDIIPITDLTKLNSALITGNTRVTATTLKQDKWAWWNVTFSFKKAYTFANLNDTMSMFQNTTLTFANNSNYTGASRLVFNDTTNVSFYANMSGVFFRTVKTIPPGASHDYTMYWGNSSVVPAMNIADKKKGFIHYEDCEDLSDMLDPFNAWEVSKTGAAGAKQCNKTGGTSTGSCAVHNFLMVRVPAPPEPLNWSGDMVTVRFNFTPSNNGGGVAIFSANLTENCKACSGATSVEKPRWDANLVLEGNNGSCSPVRYNIASLASSAGQKHFLTASYLYVSNSRFMLNATVINSGGTASAGFYAPLSAGSNFTYGNGYGIASREQDGTLADNIYIYRDFPADAFTVTPQGIEAPPTAVFTEKLIAFHPADGVYYLNTSTYALFKYYGNTSGNDINVSVDGVFNETVSAANNTNYSRWFYFTSEGEHNITLETNHTTNTTTFYVLFTNLTNVSFTATAYETTTQNIYFNVSLASGITLLNATLSYNGTAAPCSVTSLLTCPAAVPLLQTNNTALSVAVEYWVNNSYGSDYSNTSATYTQYGVYAAWLSNVTPQTVNVTEMSPVSFTYGVVNVTPLDFSIEADINGNITSAHNTTFLQAQTSPISTRNATVNASHHLNISYGGKTRRVNVTNTTVRIARLNISYSSGRLALNLHTYDETTNTQMGAVDYNYNVQVSTQYASFSYIQNQTNVTAGTLYIYPFWATVNLTGNVIYSKTGYATRERQFNHTLTKTAQTIKLYLLPSASATLTSITVKDAIGNVVSGVTVIGQRLFYDVGAYIDVFSAVSDADGTVTTYLQHNDVYYQFILVRGGLVAAIFSPRIVTGDFELALSNVTANFVLVRQSLYANCEYNDTTHVLSCDAVDVYGYMTNASLKVFEYRLFGNVTYCSSSASGSALTLSCNLTGITNATTGFKYRLTAELEGFSHYIIAQGEIKTLGATFGLGAAGALGGLIIVVTVAFIGFQLGSGALGIVFGLLAYLLLGFLDIMPYSNEIAVSLLLVGGIIIVLIRR